MTLPCEIGLRCPYRWKNGAECDAHYRGMYLPEECPIVREGSPLDGYLTGEGGERCRSPRATAAEGSSSPP